jgi:hypothetical protein
MKKSKKFLNGFIAFAVISSSLAAALFLNVPGQLNNNLQDVIKPIQNEKQAKTECPENWKQYNHDVIGTKFCYPQKWGEPSTSPMKNVTRISDMEEEFRIQNIYYRNTLDIAFAENGEIHIMLFNDQYKGEHYPNSNAYKYGYIDNIYDLRKSENICSYKIDFDHSPQWQNTMKEIYSECKNSVKTSLTKHKQVFDFGNYGTLYTYDLRLLSFKKLTNGYFDNVLISRKIDGAHQIHEELFTLDEFFNGEKTTNVEKGVPTKSKEQFEQELKEFEEFVKTITANKPAPKIQSEFEEISGEDSNITAIRKYYWLLSVGKLKEAYEMHSSVNNVSFEKFQEWYKNTYSAGASQFEKKASDQYRFQVDYQDNNNMPEIYRVEMKVVDGKLLTISSEKMIGKKEVFGDMQAFAKQEADYNYIILAKDGKELVIDKAEELNEEYSNINAALFYNNPEFSPSGNYLIYKAYGWEWAFARIYDIKNKNLVPKTFATYSYGFAEDEKYLYDCEANAMSGEFYGRVYTIPDFKIKYELPFEEGEMAGLNDLACKYDKEKQIIKFTISNSEESRVVEYSVVEDKVVK